MDRAIRFTLYVPQYGNNLESLAHVHETVSNALSLYFGGYTEIVGRGGWFGEQVHTHENIVLYSVDVSGIPEEVLAAEKQFRILARWVKVHASQERVYLTRQEIQTELI